MPKINSQFELDLSELGNLCIQFDGDDRFSPQFEQLRRIATKLFSAKLTHVDEVEKGEKLPCFSCGDRP